MTVPLMQDLGGQIDDRIITASKAVKQEMEHTLEVFGNEKVLPYIQQVTGAIQDNVRTTTG